MTITEYNFDGLVGPSHNYAGLSPGNFASSGNAGSVSNPRAAALQGLAKMYALHKRGFRQGVLPPLQRPDIGFLRQLGFSGDTGAVLQQAWRVAPDLAQICFSASSMWVANAATVSAAADSASGRVQFTAANLHTMLHRAIEAPRTAELLQHIFADPDHFQHHAPLPACDYFADEGAANHTRLCSTAAETGVNLFVYGRQHDPKAEQPQRYPARQSLAASEAIARAHGLSADQTLFVQQNPRVIDQGVFHNDVIAVGSGKVLFCHELAFLQQQRVYDGLQQAMDSELSILEVKNSELSVEQAVQSYLFNSQLLLLPAAAGEPQQYLLLAPTECEDNDAVRGVLARLLDADNPLAELEYFDLRESMRNGGGPACLRLRVPLLAEQAEAINARVLLDEQLYTELVNWVKQHYRDRLAPEDLRDSGLLEEFANAHTALMDILQLPSCEQSW